MAKITGTALRNTLRGTSRDDIIYGLGSNDLLYGFGGNDLLTGDDGDDLLDGGSGNDTLYGGSGADLLFGGNGIDWAFYYYGATSGITVYLYRTKAFGGHASGDSLFFVENVQGTKFADTLHGDEGGNFLLSSAGNDKLYGRGGNDDLDGGAGADRLDGGPGIDWAVYSNEAKQSVTVSLYNNLNGRGAAGDKLYGIENVEGTKFSDVISGSAGGNHLVGAEGNDRLYGREGSDTLEGGSGADTLNGGEGIDWVSYFNSTRPVLVNLTTHINGGGAAGDVIVAVENIYGSRFNDTITGSNGGDLLRGGAGNDKLYGGGGNDVLDGEQGADVLDGGQGIDTVEYVNSRSGVTLNLLTNANGGGAAGDFLHAIENVEGSSFSDTITGDGQDNYLHGAAGNDTIKGGNGNDIIVGGAGSDSLDGGDGFDWLDYAYRTSGVIVDLSTNSGESGADQVFNFENVRGSLRSDTITGNGSDNVIWGLDGADQIFGLAGNDTLEGGDGDDVLTDDDAASASDEDIFSPGAGEDIVKGDGNDFVDYWDATSGVMVNLSATGGLQTGGDAYGDVLSGILSINGSGFADRLTSMTSAHTGTAILRGFRGNDDITLNHSGDRGEGGDDDDTIILKSSNQLAFGGNGNDLLNANQATGGAELHGGAGNDTMSGSIGHLDYFILELGNGADTIDGFGQTGVNRDKLAIDAAVYGIGPTLDAAEFITHTNGTIAGTGTGRQFIFDSSGRGIWFDDDGAGTHAAVLLASLDFSITSLTLSDFLVY